MPVPGRHDPLTGVTAVLAQPRLLANNPLLAELLAPVMVQPTKAPLVAGAQAVLAWGRKSSAQQAESWARAHGLPLWRLEDGFLRSVGLGQDDPALSLVVDDEGIYYDAHQASRFDRLATLPLDGRQTERARHLVQRWRETGVSKYNHAREAPPPAQSGDVLVVDQTFGDASIGFGMAGPAQFEHMLKAALVEHPAARILLKAHPDVVAGRKRGHIDALLPRLTPGERQRVQVLAGAVDPASLLAQVSCVYTVTSQMGFEALLWGVPVRCFGMPFYAGRGLTADALPNPAWRKSTDLLQLVHAALIDYPRYLDPETHQTCEVERLLDWMALQRRMRARFPAQVTAVGFSSWKRPIVKAFFAGSQVRFQGRGQPIPTGSAVALWGRQALPTATERHPPSQVIRLEDGFLRSVGLGADLVRPLSWVMDGRGMHYDPEHPSDLEHLLLHRQFSPTELARAARLRERILALGLTKYNVGQASWQRPPAAMSVVLVVGQVESDAAMLATPGGLRSNLALVQAVRAAHPQAHLVYKPHPDVVAQLREPGAREHEVMRHCDELVIDAPMDHVLRQVDEVHVLTSLAGFEALLRQVPVTVWGWPFYGGWGLTQDQSPWPRPRRPRQLDELVAAVLIEYPTYVSRHSGKFTTAERALDELQQWRLEQPPVASLPRKAWRLALRWGQRLRNQFNP